VHCVWREVIAERRQKSIRVAENAHVRLSPFFRCAEDVWHPPTLELQPEPDRIKNHRDPHQPRDRPYVSKKKERSRHQKRSKESHSTSVQLSISERHKDWFRPWLPIPRAEWYARNQYPVRREKDLRKSGSSQPLHMTLPQLQLPSFPCQRQGQTKPRPRAVPQRALARQRPAHLGNSPRDNRKAQARPG